LFAGDEGFDRGATSTSTVPTLDADCAVETTSAAAPATVARRACERRLNGRRGPSMLSPSPNQNKPEPAF
jgi:hypothetical protein